MRLNLIIQRHGLPVARILWTTTPPSFFGGNKPRSSYTPASSSVIASTKTPNAAFANGYTIAQLLEDVNEVVPLETELQFDGAGHSGSWGLEDYVVEVGGFECLHFMEVDGLLRDDDEVVIRALQTSDLRARRISGRHQISTDGRHLIDGVPFGKSYLKRPTSSRPAISIPPRKKRRTILSNWDHDAEIQGEDEEWAPLRHEPENTELYADEGTMIRHDVHGADENTQASESGADISRFGDEDEDGNENEDEDEDDEDVDEDEDEDLQQELSGLRKDMGLFDPHEEDLNNNQGMSKVGYALRSRTSSQQGPLDDGSLPGRTLLPNDAANVRPAANFVPRALHLRSSARQKPASKRPATKSPSVASSVPPSLEEDGSPRGSKIVRFQDHKKDQVPSSPEPQGPLVKREPSIAEHTQDDGEERECSESTSPSSSSSDTSSDEAESTDEDESTSQSNEPSESESGSESSSESGVSEGEEASSDVSRTAKQHLKVSAYGEGTSRTKKTNRRNKIRRKLAKLKELGALHPQADFADLRAWESVNGSWYYPPDVQVHEANGVIDEKHSTKKQEQLQFEEKRQKLLRQLESGGVDVDGIFEKDDHVSLPHRADEVRESVKAAENNEPQPTDEGAQELETEPVKKRALDVASSRRLLFGSLGVKTPRTKEDEEATRKKLAGEIKHFESHRRSPEPDSTLPEAESDLEENWQEKLVIKATECIFDDIKLSAPPFPFEQRWDREAHEIIRKRKGWGKKRRKRRMAQMYEEEGGEEEYEVNNDYDNDGDVQLNYDDVEQTNSNGVIAEDGTQNEHLTDQSGDLPGLPDDLNSIPNLVESEIKPGTIIAYKQLDLSKATQWQPKISEYRVAEVHEILEKGLFKVRLARRDWARPRDGGNEEDAPREYSGFEMPGFEDDETVDDGFREVWFGELIEPKLLQAGTNTETETDAKEPEDAQGVIMSVSSRKVPKVAAVEVESRPASTVEESQNVNPEPRDIERTAEEETHNRNDPVSEGIQINSHDGAGSPNSGVIQSPTFGAFQPSPSPEEVNANNNEQHTVAPNASQSETDHGREKDKSPAQERPPSAMSLDPLDDREDTGQDRPRENSPGGSTSSLDRVLELFNVERPEDSSSDREHESESSRYASPETSMIPNPFYNIDKARRDNRDDERDDQRTPEEQQDNSTGWKEPRVERSPSETLRAKSPLTQKRQESPVNASPRSSGFETADDDPETPLNRRRSNRIKRSNTTPNPTQTSEIVDLTASSPRVSPLPESDPNYPPGSSTLPRGPGWVQKNTPVGRRSTRSSAGRVQMLQEVSISPPQTKRRSLRRHGKGDNDG